MGFKKGPGWEARDDKERDRERRDMAFKLARAMREKQRRELEKRGLSKEDARDRLPNTAQLADFLYKTKRDDIDKAIEKEKEALGQAARRSKKSLGNIGRRTASEINNIGSQFKGYLQGKRDLRNREKEKNDTGREKKSSPSREPSTPKENKPKRETPSTRKPLAAREGKEKHNQSDSQRPISVKDVFKGVRELQRERAATPKESVKPKEKESEKKKLEPRPVRTKSEFEELKKRHPHVEDMPRWSEIEKRKDVYLHVKDMQQKGEVPDKPIREWAKDLDTSYSTLRASLQDIKQPEAFEILDRNEAARKIHEAKLAPEAFEHRIDPSDVYQHFRHLRDVKDPSVQEIASAIENMYKSSTLESRVQWAELRPYHTGGPQWLKDIANTVEQNREAVESALNKRMGLENSTEERMRLGVVDSKLYLRRQDISEYNWTNLYRDDVFHFKSLQEKNAFVGQTAARLGFLGGINVGRLIDQTTDRKKSVFSHAPNHDMYNSIKYLRGFSLGMLLDTNNQLIQDIQPKIQSIGMTGKNGQSKIGNPQFPIEKKEIDSMFASMFGAGLSDGHIEKLQHGFVYTESNRDRVDIFNKQVDKFGDVYRSERTLPNGVIRTRYCSSFGKLLETRGLSCGDKSLKNKGFPEWLLNASLEVKSDYFRPMWAEDGCFKIRSDCNGASFQWDRGVVLYDSTKADVYDHQSDVRPEHVSLVKKFGSPNEDELFGLTRQLNVGDLRALTEHQNSDIARVALELERIADANPSKLMNDEREGLEAFGINTVPTLSNITYYDGTGRLSSLFNCRTSTKEDTMKVAVACPPEDIVKKEKVDKWVESEPELERKVRDDFRKKGVNI